MRAGSLQAADVEEDEPDDEIEEDDDYLQVTHAMRAAHNA